MRTDEPQRNGVARAGLEQSDSAHREGEEERGKHGDALYNAPECGVSDDSGLPESARRSCHGDEGKVKHTSCLGCMGVSVAFGWRWYLVIG